LESVDDGDVKVERRITATSAMKMGSMQIVETLIDAGSDQKVGLQKYFLDASIHELSRRSLKGASILLIRTNSASLDDTWSGSMQFSEHPRQPTKTFGDELTGLCGVASLHTRNIAGEERTVIAVKCEHHAPNGERIVRVSEYASGLGVIGLTVDVQGTGGEQRGSYGWRLLRVEK
jgi:hypothetical protein